MAAPDPEQVNWFMRVLLEIKNTPTEVVIGFIAMMTAFLKLLGRTVNQRVEMNPKVTMEQMEDCRDSMQNHFDNGLNDVHKRIDDIYKLMAEKR